MKPVVNFKVAFNFNMLVNSSIMCFYYMKPLSIFYVLLECFGNVMKASSQYLKSSSRSTIKTPE